MKAKHAKHQEDETMRVPTTAGGVVMIVIGAVICLCGLFALLLTISFFAGAEKGEAVITSAHTGRETEMSSDGFSGQSSDVTVNYYTFSYEVNDITYTGEYKESATWSKSEHIVGEVVPVYYDPNMPEVYKMKNFTAMELVMIIFGIIASIGGILEIRNAKAYKQLYL